MMLFNYGCFVFTVLILISHGAFSFCLTAEITQPEQPELFFNYVIDEQPLIPKHTMIYKFPAWWMRGGITWISFPTLRQAEHNAKNSPNTIYNFLWDIFDPSYLDRIEYKRPHAQPEFIAFMGHTWCGDFHELDPRQGYKIFIQRSNKTPYFMLVSGVLPSEDLPMTLCARLYKEQKQPNNANWLGYFVNRTVNAQDAFKEVIDNLWFIQTQNWTMVRENMVPSSPWIIAYQNGKEPTLSYGDMVIVKCFSDYQFYWNTVAEDQIPMEKELPSHFVYEEKPDYVPLYVELDSGNLPSEISLFVNDVCMGAAVVCDSLVEIPAYVLENTDPNAEVEIRAYYEDKAAVDQIPAFLVWNSTSGAYEDKPLVLNRKNYYYKVKLVQGEGETPTASVAAIDIYPNPFNPSTTIKFNLPEATEIKLEIYNLKGQLVRTLAKGAILSGKHSIVWSGTDNHNQRVASGLYYSKLSFQNKTIVKKMVMLK